MKIIINLGREILLLGSVRESIMTPSETSSGNNEENNCKPDHNRSELLYHWLVKDKYLK
jgi:hypothetical protein